MSGAVTLVSFYRDFHAFTGGHLKVWDYFGHVDASPRHEATIRFSDSTVWDVSNPWYGWNGLEKPHRPPDIWFVAGLDWLALDALSLPGWGQRPVINLIQHVTHADPANVRYQLLSRSAIRICVGPEVAAAIGATGRVSGQVFTIPNGIDVSLPQPAKRNIDVLVVANKTPRFGARVAAELAGPAHVVHLVDTTVPRPEFLRLLASARVSVFAPNPLEGWYLPALEGMALGTIVVAADCVGNRSFCLPGVNCFRPDFALEDVVRRTREALALDPGRAAELRRAALATASSHSLTAERASFLEILKKAEVLWAGR